MNKISVALWAILMMKQINLCFFFLFLFLVAVVKEIQLKYTLFY